MNEVKISYILPCYNVENYIATCLESLIKQTLKEIEIICINDGSTDDTLSVIKSYQSKDNRIKVVTSHNQGPGYARNLGIDIALGEYINFVDPDDYLDKKTAEISYNKIKKFDTDVLSYNANVVKKGKIKQILYYFTKQDNVVLKTEDILDADFKSNFHSWHFLIKASLLKKHQITYPKLSFCEDVPFVLNLLLKAKKIAFIKNALYYYVQHQNSIVHNVKDKIFDVFDVFSLSEKILPKQYYDKFLKWKISLLVGLYYNRYKSITSEQFENLIKENLTSSEYELFKTEKEYQQKTIKKYKLGKITLLSIVNYHHKQKYYILGVLVYKKRKVFNTKNMDKAVI